MAATPLAVPERVRTTALARGETGQAWLAGLPEQVADIARRWSLTVTRAMTGGTEAFVTEARTRSGETVIVKCVITGIDPARQEIRILRAANGNGYVTLLDADEAQNILLLEKLGPQLFELNLPEDDQMRAIAGTLTHAWTMAPPDGRGFTTGVDKAAEFARAIEANWEAMGRPCAERTVAVALAAAESRRHAHDPAAAVLCHGDGHQWNTLQAKDGFKFADPDGVFAERAYDLAIPMREWPVVERDKRAHAERRCKLLAELTGVPEQPIWEWSILQLVSNTLCFPGHPIDGGLRTQLAVADAMAQ